jgi:hypothetical protein
MFQLFQNLSLLSVKFLSIEIIPPQPHKFSGAPEIIPKASHITLLNITVPRKYREAHGSLEDLHMVSRLFYILLM